MSANSATGSAAPSFQKWVIDSDVEYQLRSYALKRRLQHRSLYHVSDELQLKYPNLISFSWGHYPAFRE